MVLWLCKADNCGFKPGFQSKMQNQSLKMITSRFRNQKEITIQSLPEDMVETSIETSIFRSRQRDGSTRAYGSTEYSLWRETVIDHMDEWAAYVAIQWCLRDQIDHCSFSWNTTYDRLSSSWISHLDYTLESSQCLKKLHSFAGQLKPVLLICFSPQWVFMTELLAPEKHIYNGNTDTIQASGT